ncbi:MAG: [FeFe] hydrogenase H-cluster maturation GTPase HydF [Planctomycetaceae bacterium]|nr:[FeFe] hydrogenase H-cluster maturation GTPase HydF [Planctomycetaceae bacterium]
MTPTPKGLRLHIGLFGRRNVGKSSLLNALTRQESAIVSDVAGTTTDPVEKPMELLPIGPVLFIDTAGVDDLGSLGELRVQKTMQVFDRTEIGLLVVDATIGWGEYEKRILAELEKRNVPRIVVFNKTDLAPVPEELHQKLDAAKIPWTTAVASEKKGVAQIREKLILAVPEGFLEPPPIVSDLIPSGELAVLVVPIDKEAPKGRLILPQVQTIRDLLDADRYCLVVKDDALADALARLNRPPALVVTDSQAFAQVDAIVPKSIPLTSFSVLFARQKGDFFAMVAGAKAIANLTPQSRVLIAESCAHHPITEDIGTVKIPNLLRKYVGGSLEISHVQGHDFPTDTLSDWNLVIHCGACLWNRREMLSRILHCREAGVPITNYGLAIAFMHGILDRAVAPICK